MRKIKTEGRGNGIRNWECGLRPIGAYAYAPAGRRKIKAEGRGNGIGNSECGMRKIKAEGRGKWNWECGMRKSIEEVGDQGMDGDRWKREDRFARAREERARGRRSGKDRGRRSPVKSASLVFSEEFNWAGGGRKGREG